MHTQVETIIDVQIEERNRKTVFFRGILVVPAAIFVSSFAQLAHVGWSLGGLIVVPAMLALVFRQVYPSYALKFNHAMFELNTRVSAYALFLTDDYPSIEANPKITIGFPDIEGGKVLNRWLPLVKWLLAIPLYIVGILYSVIALLVTLIAWVMIVATGTYPIWAVDIVLGTVAFWNRVIGYTAIMVTDEYPSFSL
jgi:hypothetical protein